MFAYKNNIKPNSGPCLVIVDPQNSFHPGGSLAIPTADEDAERIAQFIRKHGDKFEEIFCTLDTHQKYHIAHPMFWIDKNGEHPAPFTMISLKDFKAKIWKPSREEEGLREWCEKYISQLEETGRFCLTIWPEHCLVGTEGHCVRKVISDALIEWEHNRRAAVHYIIKGNNSYTEHYSAIRAEVPRDDDPNTWLNKGLADALHYHKTIYFCGQAKSHCVNFTVRDLADVWEGDLHQIVVLSDCCSNVPGFEKEGEAFLSDMSAKGLTVEVSTRINV